MKSELLQNLLGLSPMQKAALLGGGIGLGTLGVAMGNNKMKSNRLEKLREGPTTQEGRDAWEEMDEYNETHAESSDNRSNEKKRIK